MLEDGQGGAHTDESSIRNTSYFRSKPHKQQIQLILKRLQRPVRLQEFERAGYDSHVLRELLAEGKILSPCRGIYIARGEYDPFLLALACLSLGRTDYTIGLHSAARIHGLISVDSPDLHIFVGSGWTVRHCGNYGMTSIKWTNSFTEVDECGAEPTAESLEYWGIELQSIYGVRMRVTSAARTVCDLLRFMDRVSIPVSDGTIQGREIAFDALKAFSESGDLDEVLTLATRLGCEDEIGNYLDLVRRYAPNGPR